MTMNIHCIGGGPGGLYAAILLKQAKPKANVSVFERNRHDDTFGFGVVFSDATLDGFRKADAPSYDAILSQFAHWDDIDVHYGDTTIVSTGHGFCGMSRRKLLGILQGRCRELDVALHFEHDVDDPANLPAADLIVAADGINSNIRERGADHFQPRVDLRPNRFIWLGTTRPLSAFTFWFAEDTAGLWRVHAYQYERDHATFIVECTDETFRRSGLAEHDENAAIAYLERLFAAQLDGHRLLPNRSHWRQFPTIACGRWSAGNTVLLGDAVHTAHFSIGSGTKLAMEDAIALRDAIVDHDDVGEALAAYERSRRPDVESLQRAAQVSLEWFENVERYHGRLPDWQFAFSLLTRSLRVSHANLQLRDPKLVSRVDECVAAEAAKQSGVARPQGAAAPPMFTPFRIRDLVLPNRVVVSPMCQYSSDDGMVDDWHLVHLGSRAIGGAGLVIAEMTDISATGRITPGCAGLYCDEHVPAWRRITDFVHAQSPAKIGVQLGHAGRKAASGIPWQAGGYDRPLDAEAWEIVAPSPLPYGRHGAVPREMTRVDMDAVLADYVAATERAEQAGFDLIEVHMAHGYLLSTFISPLTNRRTDEYGGDLASRARFPLEVLAAVRRTFPAHKPVAVRISATDWVPGGLSEADVIALAKLLVAGGCDLMDVSAGQVVPEQRPRYGRLFQTPFSELVRLEANVPTITVGNISTFEDINSVIAAGRADLCAMARAMLYNPYFVHHAATRQGYAMAWPTPYAVLDRYEPRDV